MISKMTTSRKKISRRVKKLARGYSAGEFSYDKLIFGGINEKRTSI